MSLKEYNAKRDFAQTPEPSGRKMRGEGHLRFCVQMHAASRLHYDFRLEMDGVLRSWAVPKGPSLNSQEQRLAVYVEDHPIEYGSFEGVIPKGNYGAGTVMLWDQGTYVERGSSGREDSERAMLRGLADGHMTFILDGKKLRGEFALIRLKRGDEKNWLLVKKRDEYFSREDVTQQNLSVKTGRSIKEIASDAPEKGEIWFSRRVSTPEGFVPKPRAKKARALHATTPEKELARSPTREKMPRRNKPLLPASAREAFDQPGWLFERFDDGFRAIAELEKGRVHVYSRFLIASERKFPEIVEALRQIPHYLVLDGEIVQGRDGPVYWVSDLLHADGVGLRDLPLEERKRRLAELPIFGERVRLREFVLERGSDAYASALAAGTPYLVAKDARSRYRAGTSRYWLKIPVRSPTKKPGTVVEGAAESPRALATASLETPGVQLTHLDKVFWPSEKGTKKRTKGDVVEYYRKISPWILPHLRDRPQSLNRHPNGIHGQSFYQKDVTGHLPRFVKTEGIYSESADKTVHYLVCQNLETLLYVANLGCIELNPWISRVQSREMPDFCVIDIDPDDSNTFEQVIQVASETHKVLNAVGAMSFVKTSGATGLHICVPTGARFDFDVTRDFAHKVAQLVNRRLSELTSLERSPSKRRGRIYLDFLQNRKGQTLSAPYCIRPRLGAPVSTPLHWSEVRKGLNPLDFNVDTIFDRLMEVGDLWRPLLTSSVDLTACMAVLEGTAFIE